jgi:replicative DNA helicase
MSKNSFQPESSPDNGSTGPKDRISPRTLIESNTTFNRLSVRSGLDALKELDHCLNNPLPIIHAGFPNLEKAIGGWREEGISILSGGPGMGKSTFAKNVIDGFLRGNPNSRALALFNEQHPRAMDYVTLGTLTGIDTNRLREGGIKGEEWDAVQFALESMGKWYGRYSCIQHARCELSRFEEVAGEYLGQGEPRLLVIDSLQGWRYPHGFGDRRSEIDFLISWLNGLKVRLKTHILCISHLARRQGAQGYKTPTVDMLKESGGLEYEADIIIALAPPRGNSRRDVGRELMPIDLHIQKNKEGPTGRIHLETVRSTGWFGESSNE